MYVMEDDVNDFQQEIMVSYFNLSPLTAFDQ